MTYRSFAIISQASGTLIVAGVFAIRLKDEMKASFPPKRIGPRLAPCCAGAGYDGPRLRRVYAAAGITAAVLAGGAGGLIGSILAKRVGNHHAH
jgi:hypothetical protein